MLARMNALMVLPSLRAVAVSLVVAFAGAACAHGGQGASAPSDPAAVRAAIEGNLAQFSAAMKRADAGAIASMFTEDGEYIVAATNGFTTGRAAIEELFAGRFKAARFLDVTITTVSVQVDGGTAYETGTNKVTLQAGDGPAVTRTGRYLTVWKHQPDGVWRIRVDAIVPDPSP
jgi:uncharacterized protein (TIGR02246 family)